MFPDAWHTLALDKIFDGGGEMPQIAQHEAAELWELARDHFVSASTLSLMANAVQDPQLRSMLTQHCQRHQQIGQQLQQFLQQPGSTPLTPSATWTNPHGSAIGSTAAGMMGGSLTAPDVIAAAACLEECKTLAVKSMIGATESSQPARNFLFQIAGEHLRMAEEHYHWLEQRGFYASPRAEQTAIQDYVQKLNLISSAAMQLQQTPLSPVPQAVAQVTPSLQGVAQSPTTQWLGPTSPTYAPGSMSMSQVQGQQGMGASQPPGSENWQQYALQYAPQLVNPGYQQ